MRQGFAQEHIARGAAEAGSMTARRLTEFAQVKRLYKSRLRKDFARSERKPLSAMRKTWNAGAYLCYGLFDGEEIAGYAFFVRRERAYLLDYLAIAAECRGAGAGTAFLRQLAECLPDADCVLVEVEDPERAPDGAARLQRERRERFYLRCGYRETGLRSELFGVDYRILVSDAPAAHSEEELRAVYTELYRSILPKLFFRTRLRVSRRGGDPTE